jgi:hypothetical protein
MAGIKTGISGQINNNIITDGLVFYVDPAYKKSYPGTGTVATDLSSNISTTLQSSGMFENVNAGIFSFDGGTNYIDCGNTIEVQPSSNLTCNCWVNVTTMADYEGIVSAMINATGYSGWALRIVSSKFDFALRVPGSWKSIADSDTIITGQWYNLTITFDTNNMRLYVNGEEKNSTSQSGNIEYTGARQTVIGAHYTHALRLHGSMGPTQIYNKALSPAEITQNYQAQKERFGL